MSAGIPQGRENLSEKRQMEGFFGHTEGNQTWVFRWGLEKSDIFHGRGMLPNAPSGGLR